MRAAERLEERGGRFRHRDPVHVVRHQAVPHQRDAELGRCALNQLKIDVAIAIGKEDGLAVNAALGKVVGDAREYGSGHAGHTKTSGRRG
ncbi:MAG: hypothetical protein JWO19_2733 [Bryobacterales bacterium]|nr:hypothetical protein [Bryobacterales bacterium]